MEWHPCFGDSSVTGQAPPSRSSSCKSSESLRRAHRASHPNATHLDFGTWYATDFKTGKPQFKQGNARSQSFLVRTIAPHVVERLPQSRSYSAFTGFDPQRDLNYFDSLKRSNSMRRPGTPPRCNPAVDSSLRGLDRSSQVPPMDNPGNFRFSGSQVLSKSGEVRVLSLKGDLRGHVTH
eukprot:gnl/TRDRNA2_/TRDRNA2_187479_c0_seq1.p1 gnl/TRDRNA2_/TRDRNA2_187479_c0~~gnl/TRDRNA2_/TRDRNA2_187479_c0_seq1.p1  ORF type:complete len:179 (+),score=12.59 gnl/TRDRNA2_/TRDRNA2_187479_c0_seq1:75-611(+)